jgi:hypothetical protein
VIFNYFFPKLLNHNLFDAVCSFASPKNMGKSINNLQNEGVSSVFFNLNKLKIHLQNLKWLKGEFTHEISIMSKLSCFLTMTTGSCKENGQKLYMWKVTCKENRVFLYMSTSLYHSRIPFEEDPFNEEMEVGQRG